MPSGEKFEIFTEVFAPQEKPARPSAATVEQPGAVPGDGTGAQKNVLPILALIAGGTILAATTKRNATLNMARKTRKRTSRRSSSKAYAAPRRRKMNGVRRRARGRIRAAQKQDIVGTISTVAQLSGGAVLGAIGVGFAKRFVDNYYARCAIVGGVGVALAMTVKPLRTVALGIATGAAVGAGTKALASTSLGAQLMQGARRLSEEQYRELRARITNPALNAQPQTLTGQPMTLNASRSVLG